MYKVAHLILVHQSPQALSRLITGLSHPDADIYIHVDRKVNIESFYKALASVSNVYFVKNRVEVNWGGFSMIEATLNTLQEIVSQSRRCDHINFLSESDYPLMPAQKIHAFLSEHQNHSFMEMHLSDSEWWQEAQQKVQQYYFVDTTLPGKYLFERLVNKLTPKRTLPFNMLLTGRSQWMTLAITHVQFILEYIYKYPQIGKFFRHTWGPDEFFFQTLLYNSEHRKDLINDNLRYIDWSEGKASPKTLLSSDFAELENSGKLYARKFNSNIDSEILGQIDDRLLKY